MPALEQTMSRTKSQTAIRRPDGEVLAENLMRLGYVRTIVAATDVTKVVTERLGKHERTISRQRLSAMLNAIHIRPETIETLAKGLGVKAAELMKQ